MKNTKNVAILTQPLHNNYGGILQNYAMQKVLLNLDFVPTTIDVQYPKPVFNKALVYVKIPYRFLKKIMGDESVVYSNLIKQYSFINQSGYDQLNFINKYINRITVDNIRKLEFKDYDFESYLVGSDQVWRLGFSPNIKNYFLDFVPSKKNKISYAASFGVDYWEYSDEMTEQIKTLIDDFNAISVREDSAVKLCKDYLSVDSQHVLDPTMLLNKEDYYKLIENFKKDTNKKNAVVYILDMNKSKKDILEDVLKSNDFEISRIGKIKNKKYPSIESWIAGIANSDFVVTDSYHGMVFSIIFNKPFVVIGNVGRGLTRFTSLLNLLDINDRMVLNFDDYSNKKNKLFEIPDYTIINQTINTLQKLSINFLTKNLKNEA
jgi:hypothetical protein